MGDFNSRTAEMSDNLLTETRMESCDDFENELLIHAHALNLCNISLRRSDMMMIYVAITVIDLLTSVKIWGYTSQMDGVEKIVKLVKLHVKGLVWLIILLYLMIYFP